MKGLRGATTIAANTESEIKEAVLELWDTIIQYNDFKNEDIVSLIFTCTEDIDAAYPGKYVRLERGVDSSSIIHFNEMKVVGSLKLCIRILLQLDVDKNTKLVPVYLRGAKVLRPDLKLPEKN